MRQGDFDGDLFLGKQVVYIGVDPENDLKRRAYVEAVWRGVDLRVRTYEGPVFKSVVGRDPTEGECADMQLHCIQLLEKYYRQRGKNHVLGTSFHAASAALKKYLEEKYGTCNTN